MRARELQHERPVAQRVRADRHHHERVDIRLDDRPAARQRVGRGAGRRRDDQAVAAVRVDVAAVDGRHEIEHAARFALLKHDVVQRDEPRMRRRRPRSARSASRRRSSR